MWGKTSAEKAREKFCHLAQMRGALCSSSLTTPDAQRPSSIHTSLNLEGIATDASRQPFVFALGEEAHPFFESRGVA